MTFFVYILHSPAYDKYYIGQTNAVNLRLIRHNDFENTNSFTSKYRPWELKAFVNVGDARSEAIKLERYLKKLKSKKVIEQLAHSPEQFIALANKVLGELPPQ